MSANNAINLIQNRLKAMQDEQYKRFQCALIPTVDPQTVIGVRTPQLRAFAKEIYGTKTAEDFIRALPHDFYEENNLHGFLISYIKDYDAVVFELDRFLPFVNNWATCDGIRPAAFKNRPQGLLGKICEWTASEQEFTVRFGLEMLMLHYLDEGFCPEYLDIAANLRSDAYYVKMMQAWFFATALTKQFSCTLPYIEQKRLDRWTHNKAIQKAVESRVVTNEQKTHLKKLKW